MLFQFILLLEKVTEYFRRKKPGLLGDIPSGINVREENWWKPQTARKIC